MAPLFSLDFFRSKKSIDQEKLEASLEAMIHAGSGMTEAIKHNIEVLESGLVEAKSKNMTELCSRIEDALRYHRKCLQEAGYFS